MQSRRELLSNIGRRAAFLGMAGRLLGIPGLAEPDQQGTVVATLKIDDNPNLKGVGGFVLLKDTSVGELLIVHSGDEQFNALSNVCPHKQCHVAVKSPTLIKCPCHGSAFKIDGTYVSGPAKKNLRKYSVSVEGFVITVTEE